MRIEDFERLALYSLVTRPTLSSLFYHGRCCGALLVLLCAIGLPRLVGGLQPVGGLVLGIYSIVSVLA